MIQPVPKPVPAVPGKSRRCALGRLHADAPRIFVYERALEQVLDYSDVDTSRELGGFLIGGYYTDGQPYVEVRQFLDAVHVRSDAASLTFTHGTWAAANREIAARYPDDLIVGWQHTHPNLGVFLSGYDLFIHRHFFPEPWQIALVVDPVAGEFGFYQWREGQIVDCGFICVRDA